MASHWQLGPAFGRHARLSFPVDRSGRRLRKTCPWAALPGRTKSTEWARRAAAEAWGAANYVKPSGLAPPGDGRHRRLQGLSPLVEWRETWPRERGRIPGRGYLGRRCPGSAIPRQGFAPSWPGGPRRNRTGRVFTGERSGDGCSAPPEGRFRKPPTASKTAKGALAGDYVAAGAVAPRPTAYPAKRDPASLLRARWR